MILVLQTVLSMTVEVQLDRNVKAYETELDKVLGINLAVACKLST